MPIDNQLDVILAHNNTTITTRNNAHFPRRSINFEVMLYARAFFSRYPPSYPAMIQPVAGIVVSVALLLLL
jgi:hypothetical protein